MSRGLQQTCGNCSQGSQRQHGSIQCFCEAKTRISIYCNRWQPFNFAGCLLVLMPPGVRSRRAQSEPSLRSPRKRKITQRMHRSGMSRRGSIRNLTCLCPTPFPHLNARLKHRWGRRYNPAARLRCGDI